MIRRLLRRCDYRGCWRPRKVDVQMLIPGPNPREIRESFCVPHGDVVLNAGLPHAGKVDVWGMGGDHVRLVDGETAVRMQAIADGTGLRQARRKLAREGTPAPIEVVQHWHGSE